MKYKYIISICIAINSVLIANSQSFIGISYSDNNNCETTIGEPFSESNNATNVTSGFLQGYAPISSGIDLTEIEQSWTLYPNPVKDFLSITPPPKFINHRINIEIFAITGSLVYSSINELEQSISLNLSNLAKGVYILKIKDSGNNNSIYSSKLIKQ
ncbi:MAG: T9SS type A sorting domain-containing protein [Muribaculaceae bacterium]|nr:T9SS type A sorting domain-containing protein [Muribaculaceae bacterium]